MNTEMKFHNSLARGSWSFSFKGPTPLFFSLYVFLWKNNFQLYCLIVFVHKDIALIFTVGGKLSDRISRSLFKTGCFVGWRVGGSVTVCVFRINVWLHGGSHEVISAVLPVCFPILQQWCSAGKQSAQECTVMLLCMSPWCIKIPKGTNLTHH